jgi:hypothetical protein
MARRKLSAKQQAAWQAEQDARLSAFEAFRDRFAGKPFSATVRWFDRSSGVGQVQGNDGEGIWTLYACNIPGKRTWYPETACVFHEAGEQVTVEIHPSMGTSLCVSHTAGRCDADKWARLDTSRLAFRCDEEGRAANGLFGMKGA